MIREKIDYVIKTYYPDNPNILIDIVDKGSVYGYTTNAVFDAIIESLDTLDRNARQQFITNIVYFKYKLIIEGITPSMVRNGILCELFAGYKDNMDNIWKYINNKYVTTSVNDLAMDSAIAIFNHYDYLILLKLNIKTIIKNNTTLK